MFAASGVEGCLYRHMARACLGLPTSSSAPSACIKPCGDPAVIMVSACLLGKRVNYRGEAAGGLAKRQGLAAIRTAAERFPEQLKLVAVCPEAVLGVPRPPIRLVVRSSRAANQAADLSATAIVTSAGEDVTKRMRTSFDSLVRLDSLDSSRALQCFDAGTSTWVDMHGFIGKRRSPSCALLDARTYTTPPLYEQSPGAFTSHVLRLASQLEGRGAFPIVDERLLDLDSPPSRGLDEGTKDSRGPIEFIAAVLRRKWEGR